MQLQFIRSQQRLYTMDDRGLVINNYDCRSAFVPGYNESGQPRESLPNGKYWCKAEIGDFGAPYGTFYITTHDYRARDIPRRRQRARQSLCSISRLGTYPWLPTHAKCRWNRSV